MVLLLDVCILERVVFLQLVGLIAAVALQLDVLGRPKHHHVLGEDNRVGIGEGVKDVGVPPPVIDLLVVVEALDLERILKVLSISLLVLFNLPDSTLFKKVFPTVDTVLKL